MIFLCPLALVLYGSTAVLCYAAVVGWRMGRGE